MEGKISSKFEKSGRRQKSTSMHNLWKETVLNQSFGAKKLYEYSLRSAYLAILTIAGYHLPVEVLCDADDPGDGIHLELPLTVTVHHLVVDTPILTLHRKHAVKLY